jgi:hypothetical protein
MCMRFHCSPGALRKHRFACKAGMMSQEIVDCLARPQMPAAALQDRTTVPEGTAPADEADTHMPAGNATVSVAAPPQGAVAMAEQVVTLAEVEGAQASGSEAQQQSGPVLAPVATKPITWFVPTCS